MPRHELHEWHRCSCSCDRCNYRYRSDSRFRRIWRYLQVASAALVRSFRCSARKSVARFHRSSIRLIWLLMEYQPRVTPIHPSLLEPRLFAGVERSLAIMNGTLTMVMVMGLQIVAYIAVGILFHLIFAYITKIDDKYVKAYLLYNKQADVYQPWPMANQKINERPFGYGRGLLL